MTREAKMLGVRERFLAGAIPVEELLLHVEPLLRELVRTKEQEEEAKKLVNAIEIAIFTQPEPARSAVIGDLLSTAVRVVRAQEAG